MEALCNQLFATAKSNMAMTNEPCQLVISGPEPFAFAGRLREIAGKEGFHVYEFMETFEGVEQHNVAVAKMRDMDYQQLCACREGRWRERFGKKL